MGAAVSIREQVLGTPSEPEPSRTQVASAVRAIDAAMAALEAARLAVIGSVAPTPAPAPSVAPVPSEGCEHPIGARQETATFGGTVYFCGACGEQV